MDKLEQMQKQELLDKIYKIVNKRMSDKKSGMAVNFINHYFRNVSLDDMAKREVEDLYGEAISMWNWGQTRIAGEPKIRVYNPRFDKHGWHSTHTVIEIVNDDMPFLVDSIGMELNRQNISVHYTAHPVFIVSRDKDGKAIDFPLNDKTPKDGIAESFMHVEVDEQSAVKVLQAIKDGLEDILHAVRLGVEDWQEMRDTAEGLIKNLKKLPPKGFDVEIINETGEFLSWLHADRFTFLGYRKWNYKGEGNKSSLEIDIKSGLGILRDPKEQVFEGLRNLGNLPDDIRQTVMQPDLVRITKANKRSKIHRPVHMDTIAIKIFDDKGNAIGEHLFIGLLTSVAYNQSPSEIPFLRSKVKQVLDESGFVAGGHNAKSLSHILESYPRDELFQISAPQLKNISLAIVQLQERQRISLFLRPDPFQRYISAIVYVPRDDFSTTLRQHIGQVLATSFDGSVASHYTHMSEEPLSRVHFIIKTTPGQVPKYNLKEVEARIIEAGRTWEDKLRQALIENKGEEAGLGLLRCYAEGFSINYKENFNAQTAIFDIEQIEKIIKSDELGVNLYHPIEAEAHQLRFKVYHKGGAVILSDILPMIENMGLKVMEESPFDVKVIDADYDIAIHDFALETTTGKDINFNAVRDVFHESFKRVWRGEIENDGFNRLVLMAGLDWRDVVVLRAYSKYLRQASIPFSQNYMEETLAKNSGLAAVIAELFKVRFDPDINYDDAAKREQALVNIIGIKLDMVENLDEDRILRRFLNIIQSTLRTNFYQLDEAGKNKSYISLKFASREIDEIPQPAPLREIFVYSPRFEAVHLRFGLVARGGLRWSDRREDFRTEILGLVKAQQVKNAVIVPVGSKGGFVLKKAPASSDRAAFMEEGIACYRLFMQGMLDITDNLIGDNVIPPKAVIRKDDDDPYLVVAADKGTATFSDFANAKAIEYGFWLGDAFASGGSVGYDHKIMGITAKGAWESVKRHFREIDHDIQKKDFSVIGVGDMGGDVFGNGMLLSKYICLKAAFNHLHIFIDPTPDADKSFVERQRLFDDVKGWDNYNKKLISKGGGIFDRSAKSIKLTSEIKQAFDIKEDELTPNKLIQKLLKAKIDLLWFGGIGTYLKHSNESHTEVGDRANDLLRIDANQLNCKVIGEGANLGMTHLARIEFAQNGGRCNTDAIDNSAGVDCSDHEVNIKILLGDVVSAGDMTEKQRNKLLVEMTDDVSKHCLRDNYQQTQSISMIEARAAVDLSRHQRVIRAMERSGDLDRGLEFLPDDEEIGERLQTQHGLSRPELSVIFAYAKNITYKELLESDLPDDPLLSEDLIRYFPPALQENFLDNIKSHKLRREIIATVVTNSMINRTGPAFVNEMKQKTGMLSSDIARAYTITREVFQLRPIWAQIEALDNIASSAAQNLMLQETWRTINRMTEWFLRNEAHPLDIAKNIETYQSGVEILKNNLDGVLGEFALNNLEKRTKRFVQKGVPQDLANSVGQLKILSSAVDVVRLAQTTNMPVLDVGVTYTSVGTRFGFDWLRSAANRITANNQWNSMALGAIIDDLWGLQSELVGKVLIDKKSGSAAIDLWIDDRRDAVDRIDQLLGELNSFAQLDLAMLAVVSRELRGLITG